MKPLISAFLGLATGDDLVTARLGAPLPANDQRQDYIRARFARGSDGLFIATPYPKQDSSMQRTFAEAGALIMRPPLAAAAKEGDSVSVLVLDF